MKSLALLVRIYWTGCLDFDTMTYEQRRVAFKLLQQGLISREINCPVRFGPASKIYYKPLTWSPDNE